MACRNGHERTNGYVKRHKFCRSRINTNDIVNVAAVWNICLADMIHEDIVLTKDTERSNALADKILEMQPVLDNPLSAWWNDKKVNQLNKDLVKPTPEAVEKNLKKDLVVKVLGKDYCQICGTEYKRQTWDAHKSSANHQKQRKKLMDAHKSLSLIHI